MGLYADGILLVTKTNKKSSKTIAEILEILATYVGLEVM